MYHVITTMHGRRKGYGITDGRVKIEGISPNRSKVEILARRCRRERLDPTQLGDIAQDWVQEQAMI